MPATQQRQDYRAFAQVRQIQMRCFAHFSPLCAKIVKDPHILRKACDLAAKWREPGWNSYV
jgi:hypothetical protein